jgi:serine/threonine protein kinase
MEFVDDATGTTYSKALTVQRGRHGHVYKAVSSQDQRTYALKVIADDVRYNDLHIFKTCLVQHENIVRFYGDFRQGNKSILVLEYCDGGSLQARRRYAGISDKQTLSFARDLYCGLAHLHDVAQIIHMDIKPQNLLTTSDHRLRICDFSLSVPLHVSRKGMFGHPAYMAPEMFLHKRLSAACDVWSAGCVVYFMTYGKSPFEWAQTPDKDCTKLRDAICSNNYKPLDGFHPDIVRLVTDSLVHDPALRPTSAIIRDEFFALQGA